MLSQQGYEELRVSNERAKEELRAREHQHREQQAELLGLKTQVGQMQKELETKSVELTSASKALEEAENQQGRESEERMLESLDQHPRTSESRNPLEASSTSTENGQKSAGVSRVGEALWRTCTKLAVAKEEKRSLSW